MKKIIVPTDFSAPANNAARYALHLATILKEDIVLCNAMIIPAEAAHAGNTPWPLEGYESIKFSTTQQLQALARHLDNRLDEHAGFFPEDFHPEVSYTSEVGPFTDVIRNVIDEHNGSMVVMGMSGAGGLERFFMGSSSRDLLDKASFPVMLIPKEFVFGPVKKIAFATTLDEGDINVVHALACFAKALDAEIQIHHITKHQFEREEEKYKADAFMSELCKKVTYPKLSYHHIKSMGVDAGLDWLHEHKPVDMLVMVHRRHNFLDKILSGSHTQQLARRVTLPLLVFPPEYGANI
ncbi:MAG: universal stress protein [Bacteroidota bacterium]